MKTFILLLLVIVNILLIVYIYKEYKKEGYKAGKNIPLPTGLPQTTSPILMCDGENKNFTSVPMANWQLNPPSFPFIITDDNTRSYNVVDKVGKVKHPNGTKISYKCPIFATFRPCDKKVECCDSACM